jgi:hypothetical protein
VKLIPGGPHGFPLFLLERFEPAQIGRKAFLDLLKGRLRSVDSGFNLSCRKPCIFSLYKSNMKKQRTWSVAH